MTVLLDENIPQKLTSISSGRQWIGAVLKEGFLHPNSHAPKPVATGCHCYAVREERREPSCSLRRTYCHSTGTSAFFVRIMNVVEKINRQVQRLPERTQVEVLDFVEYLLTKTEREQGRGEDQDWTQLSLASAMRDIEGETDAEYTEEDLEERFPSS